MRGFPARRRMNSDARRQMLCANLCSDKVTGNVGILGTGLSYRQSLDKPGTPDEPATRCSGARVLFRLVLAAVVIYVLVG